MSSLGLNIVVLPRSAVCADALASSIDCPSLSALLIALLQRNKISGSALAPVAFKLSRRDRNYTQYLPS